MKMKFHFLIEKQHKQHNKILQVNFSLYNLHNPLTKTFISWKLSN